MYLELKENRPHGTTEYPYTQYHINCISNTFQFPVHWHDELEIIYIKTGPLNVIINGQEYIGNTNSIFLVNPGELHLMGSKGNSVDYFTILFPLEFISFQTQDWLEKEIFFPLRNHTKVIINSIPKGNILFNFSQLLDDIIELNNKNIPQKQIDTRILLLKLMQLIIEESLLVNSKFDSYIGIQKELLSYIQQNYCSQLSLHELATHFHLSEKYISRYFKKNFYITVSQYIRHLRLTHAKHLLETTNLLVTEIALLSGFSNVSYFIRTFKTNYGISPLKYRNS